MTPDLPPAPNGPPLPLGEGWGEGAESTQTPQPPGNAVREQARSYEEPCHFLLWDCQPVGRITADRGMAEVDGSVRMTPNLPLAPNGPLSLQGEGWGEGTASTQTPQPPGNAVREQARSYEEPCQFLLWDCQPVGRITADAGMAEVDGSVRMTPNLPLAPNGPLSLQGEGWGEGTASTQTPQPPGNAVREQARSYEEPCQFLLWDCQPVGRITADAGMAEVDGSVRMTPNLPLAPNGPLSLWERAGVRVRSQPERHSRREAPFASKLAPTQKLTPTSHGAPHPSLPRGCARWPWPGTGPGRPCCRAFRRCSTHRWPGRRCRSWR